MVKELNRIRATDVILRLFLLLSLPLFLPMQMLIQHTVCIKHDVYMGPSGTAAACRAAVVITWIWQMHIPHPVHIKLILS